MNHNPQHNPIVQYLDSIAAKNAAKHIGKAKVRPTGYFLPIQLQWIFDNSPRKFCVKGRQFGWTDITTFRHDLLLGCTDRKIDTWATSTDQTQASLFIEDAARWTDLIISSGKFGE
jgi:phage FluMu gp28-like protein